MKRKSSLRVMLLALLSISLCNTLAHAQSGSQKGSSSQSQMSDDKESSDSNRVVMVASNQSFDKTYDALKQAIESKDLKVIAEIDHAENAKSADMKLPPTKVILFGNPKMGTPLMKANQSMSLDLPQRIAVYEDAEGKVHIIYNNPEAVAKEHQLTGQDEIIGKVSSAMKMLTSKAAGSGTQ